MCLACVATPGLPVPSPAPPPPAELPFMNGGQCDWWYRWNGDIVPGLAACSCHSGSTHSLTAAPSAQQGSHGWVVPAEVLTQHVPASLPCGDLWSSPASIRASGCRMPTCMDMAAATWPQGLKVEGAPTWPGYATSEGRAWSLEGCGLSAAGPTESRPPSMPHPLGRGLGQLKWGHAAWPFSALLSLPGREQPQTCSRGWSRWLESWVQLPSAQLMSGWRWFGALGKSVARPPSGKCSSPGVGAGG